MFIMELINNIAKAHAGSVADSVSSRRGLADGLLGDRLVSYVVDAYRVLLGGPGR